MSSGIILPSVISLAASASEALIFSSNAQQVGSDDAANAISSDQPWTPPQYAAPAQTILISPGQNSAVTGQASSAPINYVFDAVFRLHHRRTVKKTTHPILTGANLSDHAYVMPAQVTLEIGMSDVMSSYQDNIWTGASTKSISAWQILKTLELSKVPLTIITRLDTYVNMVITDVYTTDDNRTNHALKATIVFEENLIASVASVTPVSARPQTTGTTPGGIVQGIAPNGSQVQQFQLPSPLYPNVQTYPSIPGAGSVSSNSLSNLPQVFTGDSK